MDTVVQPWLKSTVKGGQFESFDGTKIQYYEALNPNAKAAIVIVHGFCEFFGKFHEMFYDFYEHGYSVFFIEQRGHGLSGRTVPELDRVDVKDFRFYPKDLRVFLDKIVKQDVPDLPLLLYAHSMGGAVSAMFLEMYPKYFKAAVLSSPMLKMSFGGIPSWGADMLVVISKILHWNDKLMPGQTPFDPDKPDFASNAGTSKARYDYQFELRSDPASGGVYTMNGGTYTWGRAAISGTKALRKVMDRIQIPVLICQAGKDTFVDNAGEDELLQKAPNANLIRFPNAKHEIYNCTDDLEDYYRGLFRFFDAQVSQN